MPHVARIINPKRVKGSARLLIRISGRLYGLTRIDRRPSAVLEGWRLTKPDGTTYDCGRTRHGYSCDCPDYVFRREDLEPDGCKHCKALVAVGLLGRPTQEDR